MTVEQKYKTAAELLAHTEAQLGFSVTSPVDVDLIAEVLGISVETDVSLEQRDIVGEICFVGDVPTIRINPLQNNYGPRRRFTLAHEIGHYCLHSSTSRRGFTDSRKTMSRTESYWDSFESEANSFAAQLLMPKSLILSDGQQIINQYKELNGAKGMPVPVFIEKMADKFSVSSKAMEYRLKNLGIIK